MTFFIVYLFAMTVPGAALTAILGLNACRTAMAIALSLVVMVLALLAARVSGSGTAGLAYWLAVLYVAIGVGVAVSWLRGTLGVSIRGRIDPVWAIPLSTFAIVACYALWAGAYTEIPGDPWWHIARVNDRLVDLSQDRIGGFGGLGTIFSKDAGIWYTVSAFLLRITGSALEPSLEPLATANTLLFSAAIYAFTLYIFQPLVPERARRHAMAACAVVFFIAHFGISVFSYVRYYVYGPTLLNYVVYLAAVACVLCFIRQKEGAWRFPAIAVILAIVAAMVHTQEAAFIVVMSSAIVLTEFLRARLSAGAANPVEDGDKAGRRVAFLFFTVIFAYIAIHGWAYLSVTRHNPLAHGVLADTRNYLPFLHNLYVLRPTYQFYQVVTVWGVAVYALFLFKAPELKRSPFLLAGMAMPVLTVFNPVFTDLFLRFSWPEVLWRMCYMLPLPFVGAYCLVKGVEGTARASGVAGKLGSLAISAALLILLFPINSTFFVSPYSRIYTLAPVAPENNHRHWQDLREFLESLETTRIVTDPVTGYLVNGLTSHRYRGYKFYGAGALPVDQNAYTTRNFLGKRNWVVVVNRRDGAYSETGRHGGHWPADVLKVSRYYSPAFLEFIEGHPDIFETLWSRDRISVYRVHRSRQWEPNGQRANPENHGYERQDE